MMNRKKPKKIDLNSPVRRPNNLFARPRDALKPPSAASPFKPKRKAPTLSTPNNPFSRLASSSKPQEQQPGPSTLPPPPTDNDVPPPMETMMQPPAPPRARSITPIPPIVNADAKLDIILAALQNLTSDIHLVKSDFDILKTRVEDAEAATRVREEAHETAWRNRLDNIDSSFASSLELHHAQSQRLDELNAQQAKLAADFEARVTTIPTTFTSSLQEHFTSCTSPLETRLDTLHAAHIEQAKAIDSIHPKFESSLKDKLDAVDASLASHFTDANTRFDAQDARWQGHEEHEAALKMRLDNIDSRFASLLGLHHAQSTRLDELEHSSQAQQTSLTTIFEDRIAALTSSLQDHLSASTAVLTSRLDALQESHLAHTTSLDAVRKQVEDSKGRFDALEAFIPASTSSLSHSTTASPEVNNHLDKLDTSLRSHTTSFDTRLGEVSTILDEVKTRLDKFDSALQVVQSVVQSTTLASQSTSTAVTSLESKFDTVDSSFRALDSSTASTNSTILALEPKVQSLDSQVHALAENTTTSLRALGSTFDTLEYKVQAMDSTVEENNAFLHTLDSTFQSKFGDLETRLEILDGASKTLYTAFSASSSELDTRFSGIATRIDALRSAMEPVTHPGSAAAGSDVDAVLRDLSTRLDELSTSRDESMQTLSSNLQASFREAEASLREVESSCLAAVRGASEAELLAGTALGRRVEALEAGLKELRETATVAAQASSASANPGDFQTTAAATLERLSAFCALQARTNGAWERRWTKMEEFVGLPVESGGTRAAEGAAAGVSARERVLGMRRRRVEVAPKTVADTTTSLAARVDELLYMLGEIVERVRDPAAGISSAFEDGDVPSDASGMKEGTLLTPQARTNDLHSHSNATIASPSTLSNTRGGQSDASREVGSASAEEDQNRDVVEHSTNETSVHASGVEARQDIKGKGVEDVMDERDDDGGEQDMEMDDHGDMSMELTYLDPDMFDPAGEAPVDAEPSVSDRTSNVREEGSPGLQVQDDEHAEDEEKEEEEEESSQVDATVVLQTLVLDEEEKEEEDQDQNEEVAQDAAEPVEEPMGDDDDDDEKEEMRMEPSSDEGEQELSVPSSWATTGFTQPLSHPSAQSQQQPDREEEDQLSEPEEDVPDLNMSRSVTPIDNAPRIGSQSPSFVSRQLSVSSHAESPRGAHTPSTGGVEAAEVEMEEQRAPSPSSPSPLRDSPPPPSLPRSRALPRAQEVIEITSSPESQSAARRESTQQPGREEEASSSRIEEPESPRVVNQRSLDKTIAKLKARKAQRTMGRAKRGALDSSSDEDEDGDVNALHELPTVRRTVNLKGKGKVLGMAMGELKGNSPASPALKIKKEQVERGLGGARNVGKDRDEGKGAGDMDVIDLTMMDSDEGEVDGTGEDGGRQGGEDLLVDMTKEPSPEPRLSSTSRSNPHPSTRLSSAATNRTSTKAPTPRKTAASKYKGKGKDSDDDDGSVIDFSSDSSTEFVRPPPKILNPTATSKLNVAAPDSAAASSSANPSAHPKAALSIADRIRMDPDRRGASVQRPFAAEGAAAAAVVAQPKFLTPAATRIKKRARPASGCESSADADVEKPPLKKAKEMLKSGTEWAARVKEEREQSVKPTSGAGKGSGEHSTRASAAPGGAASVGGSGSASRGAGAGTGMGAAGATMTKNNLARAMERVETNRRSRLAGTSVASSTARGTGFGRSSGGGIAAGRSTVAAGTGSAAANLRASLKGFGTAAGAPVVKAERSSLPAGASSAQAQASGSSRPSSRVSNSSSAAAGEPGNPVKREARLSGGERMKAARRASLELNGGGKKEAVPVPSTRGLAAAPRTSRTRGGEVPWPETNEHGNRAHQRKFIQCDDCRVWFHYGCVGIEVDDLRIEDDETAFTCPPCIARPHTAKSRRSSLNQSLLSRRKNAQVCGRPRCVQGGRARDEYYLEAIVGRRYDEAINDYKWLVKWDGYPVSRSTWEGEESMGDPADAIKGFVEAARDEQLDLTEERETVVLAIAKPWFNP